MHIRLSVFILLFSIFGISCTKSLKKENLVNYSYIIGGKGTRGFLTSGTGSILHYADKYYLVTNFHVLTGKDVRTGQKFPELKDTNTAISIRFSPKDSTVGSIINIYSLFDSTGHANFDSFMFGTINMDISVMPINFPDNAKAFFFEESDLDLSLNYEPLANLMIYGFANAQFVNGWQPAELDAHGIKNLVSGPFNVDPFVFIDRAPIKGMSGSSVYTYNSKGQIKVLSVVTNIIDDDPIIKGRSVYMKFGLDLIKKMHLGNRSSVVGKVYRAK